MPQKDLIYCCQLQLKNNCCYLTMFFKFAAKIEQSAAQLNWRYELCIKTVLTCWHPLWNRISSGATDGSDLLLPTPVEELLLFDEFFAVNSFISFFSCVNWKRTSLSNSILLCKIPKSTSKLWFSKVGSTTFKRVLFLIKRSWISLAFRDNCLWCDWAVKKEWPCDF